ncbi:MAG: ABC transporter permease [Elusimicrobia bacterium]|nr:ABC transporter permease [Candidatus Obscuribacterium magneticum]
MNKTIVGFVKKELIQAVRDIRMRILLFVMPVVQLTIFGLALSTEVRNIRLGAFFLPHDILARRIMEHSLSSRWFLPARGPFQDPIEAIRSGRAEAILIAPPEGLTAAVERGRGRLQILIDATNAVRARSIENYLQTIINQTLQGLSKRPAAAPLLTFDVRVLYNPSMKTSIFLVPGVMVMILCLLTIILTSMAMAREKELGTFETLISAPVRNWEILLGKTLPYFLLGMADVPLIMGAGMILFGVPMRGELWELFLSAALFIATTVSVGILISTIAKNQQQAMMGGFMFLFPAMLLSGIMFPLENMPELFRWVTYANPLKYFVESLRNIMLKGGDPMVVWRNIGAMGLLAGFSIWASFKRFTQTLN